MEIVHHWKIQWINEDLKINPRDRNLTAGPSSNATHWMPEFSELLQVRTPPTESSHQRALSSCGAAYYSHTPSEFNIEVILSNKHLQKCAKVKPSPKKCEEQRKRKCITITWRVYVVTSTAQRGQWFPSPLFVCNAPKRVSQVASDKSCPKHCAATGFAVVAGTCRLSARGKCGFDIV